MSFLDLLRSFEDVRNKKNNCLFGKQIHETEDHLGIIRIFESRNRRTLTFNSAFEQSCINLTAPHQLAHQYTRGMVLPTFFYRPEKVLLLGLGGGALVHFLHHFFPSAEMEVVELRAKIIEVAKSHLALPDHPAIRLILQDAHIFIRDALPEHYDLLLTDLYLSEGMDMRQATLSFIRRCAGLLTPSGWLVCNLILPDGIKYELLQQLAEEFPALYLCNLIEGNAILLGCRADLTLSAEHLPASPDTTQRECGFDVRTYLNRLTRFS